MKNIAAALALLALAPGSAPAAAEQDMAQEALMADVTALAADAMEGRGVATAGSERARAYIARRFAEIGLTVEEQRFTFTSWGAEPREGVNFVAHVPGTNEREGVIVITAHYDHVGIRDGQIHNGADDNASGVAALLSLAAALKRVPPVHDVLLVALDAEEALPGMFGARAFIARPPVPLDRVLLNINLDMVSRGDDGDLWAAGAGRHPALRPVLERLALAAPLPLRLGHDGTDGNPDDWTMQSDQGPFHEAGIPFVFFSVTNHVDYHEPSDDAGRIDPLFFTRAATTVHAAFRAFDAAPDVMSEARAAARPRPAK